jgi:hypothetical protein
MLIDRISKEENEIGRKDVGKDVLKKQQKEKNKEK